METMQIMTDLITNLGFPIACVVALAWYSKNTTDKIITLTEKVTDALVSSTNAIEEVKDVIKTICRKE